MNINDFIEKFAEIFDETPSSDLSPETRFRELPEWSSLSALGVIAMADDEFDVELTGTELRSADTISQLFDIINTKL